MSYAAKKLIQMPPPVPSTVRERWGIAADTGWTATPYILIVSQHRLGLSSEDMNLLACTRFR